MGADALEMQGTMASATMMWMTPSSCIVYITAADDLATQGAMVSAAMVLT